MPSNFFMLLLQEIFKTDQQDNCAIHVHVSIKHLWMRHCLLAKTAMFLTRWQFYDQWLMKNHIADSIFLVNTMSMPQCQLRVLNLSQNCLWIHCFLKQIYLRERSNGLGKNIWILLIDKVIKGVADLQKVDTRSWLNRRIYRVRNFNRENLITSFVIIFNSKIVFC